MSIKDVIPGGIVSLVEDNLYYGTILYLILDQF